MKKKSYSTYTIFGLFAIIIALGGVQNHSASDDIPKYKILDNGKLELIRFIPLDRSYNPQKKVEHIKASGLALKI